MGREPTQGFLFHLELLHAWKPIPCRITRPRPTCHAKGYAKSAGEFDYARDFSDLPLHHAW